jgi:hypothetical protein
MSLSAFFGFPLQDHRYLFRESRARIVPVIWFPAFKWNGTVVQKVFEGFLASLLYPIFCTSVFAYTNNIMITGYWPPTNEMVRPFSDNLVQNPGGWIGENWEDRGYNIYSYFPEFIDFPNQPVGYGDFTVDYQDTSEDFWRITSQVNPVAIITFSRTDQRANYWELEMINRNWGSWVNDYVAPFQPTPAPPDSSIPANTNRPSTLPVQAIRTAVATANLGLSVRIDSMSGGGRFLSEFIAYHGVWYQDLHSDPNDPFYSVAAGHIHVGGGVSDPVARQALEITLRELITHVDTVLGVPEPVCGIPFAAFTAIFLIRWRSHGRVSP